MLVTGERSEEGSNAVDFFPRVEGMVVKGRPWREGGGGRLSAPGGGPVVEGVMVGVFRRFREKVNWITSESNWITSESNWITSESNS